MPDLQGVDWGEVESKLRAKGGHLYDPSDLEGIKRNTSYHTGAVDLDTALGNAYANYDQRAASGGGGGQQAASAPTQYSSVTSAGSGDAALGGFLDYIKTRDAESQKQRGELQKILMGQLGQATQPISPDSPGVRELLSGQRLSLQRGAERQRSEAAERRAYDGSGGVGGGAFEQDVNRIQEQQSEADAIMTGGVLNRELQAKRQQLQQLLTLATQLGDAESARLLQSQLQTIQTQLSQSNFYDTMGLNYASLNQQGNLQALMAMLGAF